MRQGDGHIQLVEVDGHGAAVFRVRVGLKRRPLAVYAALEVFAADVVHRENAVLRARFNRHVRDGQAAVHGDFLHAVARKFEGLIQRAVHADFADEVQNHVLAADPRLHLARQHNLNGFRHLEPAFARRHAYAHIRRTDARGECAHRAIGAGVAVRADDDFARRDNALFRQQRVLDAHAAHFVVVDDVLRAREFAHLLGQRRGLDILVRHKVIRNQRDLRGIKDLCCAHPIELVDGHGGGDVVAQHKV